MTSTKPQLHEFWVLQRLERVTFARSGARLEHWKTISKPLDFSEADRRLAYRQSHAYLHRILNGPFEALRFNGVMEDAKI
jgi:hypothetical protein